MVFFSSHGYSSNNFCWFSLGGEYEAVFCTHSRRIFLFQMYCNIALYSPNLHVCWLHFIQVLKQSHAHRNAVAQHHASCIEICQSENHTLAHALKFMPCSRANRQCFEMGLAPLQQPVHAFGPERDSNWRASDYQNKTLPIPFIVLRRVILGIALLSNYIMQETQIYDEKHWTLCVFNDATFLSGTRMRSHNGDTQT